MFKLFINCLFFLQVMELETQVQVSTNQLRRQDEDNKRLTEALETAEVKLKEQYAKCRYYINIYANLESQVYIAISHIVF